LGGTRKVNRCPTRGSKSLGYIHSARVELWAMAFHTSCRDCGNQSSRCMVSVILEIAGTDGFAGDGTGRPRKVHSGRSTRARDGAVPEPDGNAARGRDAAL